MDKKMDGKIFAQEIQNIIKEKVITLKKNKTYSPHLTVIQIGNNQSSNIYIKNKKIACNNCEINFSLCKLPETITNEELINNIKLINNNPSISAVILQLPTPHNINSKLALAAIDEKKDADGLNPNNLGNLMLNNNKVIPATPKGIILLLEHYQIDYINKHITIIGNSNIVGKPLANLLMNNNATISICNSKTKNLINITKQSDIIIIAIGQPLFLTKEMVKEDSIIIDVGINYIKNKIVGDVDYNNLYSKVKMITPVPGGIGPMTIAALLMNVVDLYQKYGIEKN